MKRSVFDYRRADFDGLRTYLRSINFEEKISDHGDSNQDWSDWKNAFSESVKMFVPVKNLNGRKFLRWMNNTILDLIKKKNSLRNRIKRNGSPSEYLRNKFKNLRSKVKRMLRESRLEYLNKICDYRDQNPKRFWSFFKSKAKYSNIPGKVSTKVNDNERKYADNTTDIANMFNHYFASIFTCDSYGSTDHQDRSHNVTTIDNITLSEEEIMAVIVNLNNNKAQGPDNIPVRILK